MNMGTAVMNTQKTKLKGLGYGLLLSLSALPLAFPMQAGAEISGANMIDYVSIPVTATNGAIPKVMFVMGKDHQYWLKAYNDFTDLDGDGEIDTTYKHDFEYYGYFDPEKCYSYVKEGVSGAGQVEFFKPMAFTTDRYCDSVAGEWSGNFLNWAAMTRMDIVRRIMFGGKRLEDQQGFTFLQRTYLPTDSHSFAKYYAGDDIHKLTPFSGIDTALDGTIDDRDRGITICNVSEPRNSGKSESIQLNTNNTPPLIRVAEGNYSLWATSERWNCRWSESKSNTLGNGPGSNGNDFSITGIPAHDDNPSRNTDGLSSGGFGPNYNMYIQACVPGLINSTNNENCRQYPNGNYKPVGLIQIYGEDETIHFGMMQGSYEKNLSGGVLRKNTTDLGDEINIETDGTLKADPNSAIPSVGMTRALDVIRLFGYGYSNGTYFGSGSGDSCGFGTASFPEGTCNSWGNPISEIYMEALRYFAGLQPTPAFEANDNSFVGGLAEDTWEDPLSADNFCASTDVIVFNTSISSYDQNQTGGITDIDGASSPAALTDTVGSGENIHGNDWFIGETPANDDGFCTAKTINSLGNVLGICPEGPTLEGGYHMAGLAHFAKTNDIRPSLEGTQSVTTYAVQLATNVPSIVAQDPNDSTTKVTILPAYRRLTNNSAGTLVDFKIITPQREVSDDDSLSDVLQANPGDSIDIGPEVAGTGVYEAKFYINWEDNEAGGDYDQDMWGILAYRLDTNNNTLTVATDAVAESTSGAQLFGFIINGTTQDAFHAYSGIEGATTASTFPAVGTASAVPGCNDCRPSAAGGGAGSGQYGVQRHTFNIDPASAANLLENPLFYAAKWGGFEDINGNGIPDLDEEWDTKLEDGSKCTPGVDCDGIPDNYFFVSNPAALEDALRRVFDAILERVSSGTAASVVANEQSGVGAVFQALYDPVKTDADENEVEWIGTLHSLFIDSDGFIREDSNGNGKLDGYQTDKVVEVFFDAGETQTKLRRFTSSADDEFVASGSVDVPLEEIQTIWNAREWLSSLADVTTQRTYTSTADNGRHITTWLDSNHNGIVDAGEQVPFAAGTFTNANYGWLDQSHDDGTTTVAENLSITQDLVNYIRGEEIGTIGAGTAKEQDTRNRTLDYDGDGSTEVMRLGDIVNSTPTPVQAPAEAFDLLAGDASYAEFRQQYANRRQVVYVGGNDGMIHAFNAGFFDATTREFKTTLGSETAHPLGAELWAYVPKNLLPHLQWLAREDYEHVYYADLKPRVFDAKIFPDDATHPNGWGTVMVMGFRLGGGSDTTGITVDTAGDGLGGANSSDDVQTKSAFVVMDITDPEQPPTVLAELTPPNLEFTTSFPGVVLVGDKDTSGAGGTPNKWYLVFGSGPELIGSVTSAQNARLYGYDLQELADGDSDLGIVPEFGAAGLDLGTDGANSFVGEISVADYDLDMKAESLYFGTIGDTDGDQGKLWRIGINENAATNAWSSAHVLLNANQPFVARPSLTLDEKGQPWIIAGTGRFYADGDKPSTATQTLYGFRDPNNLEGTVTTTSVSPGSLFDVSDTRVFADGNVDVDGDGDVDMTYEELQECTRGENACGGIVHQGWKRDYESDGTNPAQRSVTSSAVLGGVIFNTAFTPSTSQCGLEGSSILLGLGFDTGSSVGAFGAVPCPTCPNSADFLPPSVDLGFGLASSPSIHIGKPGQEEVPGKVTVVIQKSTGEISTEEAQTASGINSGEVSWREFINE